MVEQTKHIFVTGGVASSLGKGLTASSLGHLLRARGLRVTMQKLDPYLNVDPGTMNPFQHGEVFVTDDGAETDLDIGHYERFLDINLVGRANVTTGQIYNQVIAKERRGEYLGDTVQVIPHITNEIKARMRAQAAGSPGVDDADAPDIIITEIGGTVGDIESLPFLEAARQVRHDVGRDNVFFLHVSLVPYLAPSGELKTKPTQHSVAALRQVGIQPDGLVLRADREIPDSDQAQDLADVRRRHRGRRGRRRRAEHLRHPQGAAPARASTPTSSAGSGSTFRDVDWHDWDELLRAGAQPRAHGRDRPGRQVHRPARRLPLGHRGDARRWLPPRRQGARSAGSPATSARPRPVRRRRSAGSTPCSCPAASACAASRASSARSGGRASARCPTLGICLGLQCMVIEYARNVAGIEGASSTEFDPQTPAPVIATMEEQKAFVEGAGDLGRHHAPRAPTRPSWPRARVVAEAYGVAASTSGTATATRSTTATASSSRRPAWSSAALSPGARASSSSSSCRATCTPTTSRRRRTRSSSRARTGRTRCSPGWSGGHQRPARRAAGRGRAPAQHGRRQPR